MYAPGHTYARHFWKTAWQPFSRLIQVRFSELLALKAQYIMPHASQAFLHELHGVQASFFSICRPLSSLPPPLLSSFGFLLGLPPPQASTFSFPSSPLPLPPSLSFPSFPTISFTISLAFSSTILSPEQSSLSKSSVPHLRHHQQQ